MARLTDINDTFPAGPPIPERKQVGRVGAIDRLEQRLGANEVLLMMEGRRIGKTSVAVAALGRISSAGGRVAAATLTRFQSPADAAQFISRELRSTVGRAGALAGSALLAALTRGGADAVLPAGVASDVTTGAEVAKSALGKAADLASALAAYEGRRPAAVLLDEAHVLGDWPEPAQRALNAVLRDELRLGVVIASSDGEALESLTHRGGPLHLVGSRVSLPPISRPDWIGALRDRFASLQITIGESTIVQLVDMTGGHPYLTMRLARDTARIASEDGSGPCVADRAALAVALKELKATPFGRLSMAIPTIEQLHSGLRSLLADRVEVEPLILAARVGMGGAALATGLLRDTHGYELDPVAAGGDATRLAQALTRQVIASLQPYPIERLNEPELEAERARLQIARYYGEDFARALDVISATPESVPIDWTIADALGRGSSKPLLIVRDAHRLSRATTWELRELAGETSRVLLLTTPEHRVQLNGRDAPFYGMGAYVEMPTLPLRNWRRAAGPDVSPEALEGLLRATRNRTAITREVLERSSSSETGSIAESLEACVDARAGLARDALGLGTAIHELAPRLLLALAAGARPYALRAVRSDRVAQALRRLRDYDLIEQPEARVWQVADPLLGAAIQRLAQAAGSGLSDLVG